MNGSASDPVPQGVRVECKRLAERWSQLPLDRALRHVGTLHSYAVELALGDATHRGLVESDQPLGEARPELVIDQVTAVLHDAYAAGSAPDDTKTRLVELRRQL